MRTYPGAAFYGKVDDDTLLDVAAASPCCGRWSARERVPRLPAYDSFLPAKWKHCGWAAGQVGAAHASRTASRPRGGGAEGPFAPLGALTVMGADLARWMEASPYVKAFVATAAACRRAATRPAARRPGRVLRRLEVEPLALRRLALDQHRDEERRDDEALRRRPPPAHQGAV